MTTLTINNIPDELYNELKYTAAKHQRSINNQIIACLKATLFSQHNSPEEKLNSIQSLRSMITPDIITAENIDQAINEGRA